MKMREERTRCRDSSSPISSEWQCCALHQVDANKRSIALCLYVVFFN
jgi:hypothetical protein